MLCILSQLALGSQPFDAFSTHECFEGWLAFGYHGLQDTASSQDTHFIRRNWMRAMTRHSEYDGYFLKTQLSQDKASLTLDFLVNAAFCGSRASHGITANSKQDAVCTFSGR